MSHYREADNMTGIAANILEPQDVVLTTVSWFDKINEKRRPFGILFTIVDQGITMIPRSASVRNKDNPYAVKSPLVRPPYTREGYYLCNFIRRMTADDFDCLPDRIHTGKMIPKEYEDILKCARKFRDENCRRGGYNS